MKPSELLLVCLCTFGVWVAANPLAQLLLQANPKLLQNGFNNIPNLQLPFQQPKYDANPYLLSFPYMAQKSVDNCPCQPNYQAPNAISQQINQLKSGDQQLNKLLSNPMIQMILDSKTKFCNQDGIEVAKQSNKMPNTGSTPNIINNYYIITPECLDTNNVGSNKRVKDQAGNKNLRNTESKQKNIDAQIRLNHDRKRHGNSEKMENQQSKIAKSRNAHQSTENPKRSHNLENNKGPGDRKNNKTITHNNNSRQTVKKTQDKSENISNSIDVTKENSDYRRNEETLIFQNQNKTKGNSERRRQKKPHKHLNNSCDNIKEINLIAEELPFEQEAKEFESQILKTDDHIEYEKGKSSGKENKSEINRNRRSKDEAIIKEIHSRFPGIPEDVIRKLLNYLRRQLRKRGVDNCCLQTNYTPPLRYDQIFPQFCNLDFKNCTNKEASNRRRNSSNKRNRNKRRKQEHVSDEFENTISTKGIRTSSDIEFTTLPSITDELTDVHVENKTPINNVIDNASKIGGKESNTENPSPNFNIDTEKLIYSTRTETSEINNSIKFHELGEEDVIDIFPENFVDDYYPDFRADNVYLDNNENNIRNLRHNRYYYTTDRNVLKQKERRNDESTEIHYKSFRSEFIGNDKEVKIYKNSGDSSENPSSFKEIEFKTPPVLENPDFETKPITAKTESPYYGPEVKNANNDKSFIGKFSTYSMAKQVDTPSKPHSKTKDNVETVFAKSKVVKYGQKEDSTDEPIVINEPKKNNTVFVYAQSIYD